MTKQTKKVSTKGAKLTRTKVLKAAIRLADSKGMESLSMRKLAQALGVEAMSLYNHVINKEDVLDGMVEVVVGEIELPNVDAFWKDAMRRRSISAHEQLLRHPWAALLFVSRVNVGPAMLSYIDATIGCLHSAGFSYELADRAWNAIDSHVYGFTQQAVNFPFEPSEYAEVAEEFLPQLPENQYPHLNALSQQVIQGKHDGIQEFCFGLDLILDSLERIHDKQGEADHG